MGESCNESVANSGNFLSLRNASIYISFAYVRAQEGGQNNKFRESTLCEMSSPAEWTIALYTHICTTVLQVHTHFIYTSNVNISGVYSGLRVTHLTPVGLDRVVSYCNLILFILNPSLWRYYFMLVYTETCFASFSVFFFF